MRARIAASIVLAVAVVLGTAGCDMLAPQAIKHYDASDGVSGDVGGVAVRNAILISKDGKNANLVVTILNHSAKSHRLGIQYGTAGTKTTLHVTVPASAPSAFPPEPTTKKWGTPGEPLVILKNIDTKPGALYPVFFQYGDVTGLSLLVPVLDGSLNAYKDLTPEKVTAADAQNVVTN